MYKSYKSVITGLILVLVATVLYFPSTKSVSAIGSCNISASGTTSLSWSSSGLPTGTTWKASLSRDGGGTTYGLPTSSNGYAISPPANTRSQYSLFIYQNGNTSNITAGCSVFVDTRVTLPPTCSLYSNKYTVNKNEPFNLNWTSNNATSATLNFYPTNVIGNNVTQNITNTTTYILRVAGPGGSGSCGPITVTVNDSSSATCVKPDKTPVIGRSITTPSGGAGPVTVPYGTSGIDLLLSLSAYVCRTNESAVDTTYFRISNATPVGSVSGLTGGLVLQTSFPWAVGATGYAAQPFRFSPPGGFTQSGTYTISVTGTPVNHFPNEGKYICVNNAGTSSGSLNFGICNSDTLTFTVQVNVQTPPPSCTLTANPSTITSGNSSVLNWTSSNGTSWGFTDSSLTVGANGSRTVTPSVTTTYYFLVVGSTGSYTCSATVTVTGTVQVPPQCSISASKSTINLGDSTTLYWTSTNAYSATLNGSGVSMNNLGGYSVSPVNTTRYTFTAYGPGGSTSCDVIVTVNGGTGPKPTCSLSPGSTTIDEGDSVDLTWSSTWADSATLNGEPVDINNTLGYTVTPSLTTTYTFQSKGPGGTSPNCSMTITIRGGSRRFTCQPIFYQSLSNVVFGAPILEMKRLSVGPPSEYQKMFDITGNSITNINAIGYNIKDNFIYGIGTINGTPKLVRIDADGVANEVPVTLNGNSFSANSVVGDFDDKGDLWITSFVSGAPKVYKINVLSGLVSDVNINNSSILTGFNDWVYVNGSFYAIRTNNPSGPSLIKATIDNTSVPAITLSEKIMAGSPSNINTLQISSVYGAMWTTIDNKIYAGYNKGNIYEIYDYDSASPKSKLVVSGLAETNGNDGASCPNAKDPLEKINYPFLKVNGSDVIAGAKFSSGDICIAPDSTDSPFGTIKTNGFKEHGYNPTKTADILSGSSSAEYAAFAFSKIYSSGSSSSFLANNGYYRDIGSNNYARDLMFANATANQPPMEYGNFNTEGTLPCLNISQIEKQSTAANSADVINALKTGSDTQILKMSTGNLDIDGPQITIPSGRRLTIIVDGLVNINTNIVFDNSSSSDGVIHSPQLTIIAKNGIIIKDSVTRLDGYYDAHNSTLKTCDISASPSTGVCNKQLIVNGGLVGKKIEWRRNYGTLNSDLTTLAMPDNSRCSVETKANGYVSNVISAQNECAAERIDFDPLFYFNNPFSLKPGQSTISGAPLNSVELPPIY